MSEQNLDRFQWRIWNDEVRGYQAGFDIKSYNISARVNSCAAYLTPFRSETIEQCTGLRDSTGALIFEGDLIECRGRKYHVNWDGSGFPGFDFVRLPYESIFHDNKHIVLREIQIIGNIHENPELLR